MGLTSGCNRSLLIKPYLCTTVQASTYPTNSRLVYQKCHSQQRICIERQRMWGNGIKRAEDNEVRASAKTVLRASRRAECRASPRRGQAARASQRASSRRHRDMKDVERRHQVSRGRRSSGEHEEGAPSKSKGWVSSESKTVRPSGVERISVWQVTGIERRTTYR